MSNRYLDDNEIIKAVESLHPDGELFEVRLINGKDNYSGYFKNAETMLANLKRIKLNGFGVFITLNQIQEEAYSRKQKDHFIRHTTALTDNCITKYKWLLIDLDPVRISDVSSSDDELKQAERLARKIMEYLSSVGFCDPLAALSGNGLHLLYRIDLENNAENVALLKSVLSALDQMFSNDRVKVDTGNFNPSRICKLYGTKAQKGADTEERPHRMSRIIKPLSDPSAITPRERLEEVADLFVEAKFVDESKSVRSGGYSSSEEWLDNWLDSNNVGVRKDESSPNLIKYYLEEGCPFNPEHSGSSSIVFIRRDNGAICYKCQHDSCSGKGWKDFRMYYEPNAYDNKRDLSIEDGWQKHKRSQEGIPSEYDEDPRAAFHTFTKNGTPIKAIDSLIVDDILENDLPIIVYQKIPYIYTDGYYKRDEDGDQVKAMISKRLFPEMITAGKIRNIYDLLLMRTEIKRNENDLNNFPDYWINFKNGFLNVETLELIDHNPKYYAMNQIPHNYDKDIDLEGSITKKYLEGQIPNEDDRKMFLEFGGLCLTKDMRAHRVLFVKGSGGLGKSTLIKALRYAIGEENCCGISIDSLENRFAPYGLSMKLANIVSEISAKSLRDISNFKRISGDDPVRGEIKFGKDFDFKPYSKLLFICNSLPKAKDDNTDAYYRRLLILKLTKRADEIPNIDQALKNDVQALICMLVNALHEVYARKNSEKLLITESETSKEEVEKLFENTDQVQAFISSRILKTDDAKDRILKNVLYKSFREFCINESYDEKYIVNSRKFYESMDDKGFELKKSNNWYFIRIKLKTLSEEADPDEINTIFMK